MSGGMGLFISGCGSGWSLWLRLVVRCVRVVGSGFCLVRRGIWGMMMWIGRCIRGRSIGGVIGGRLGIGLSGGWRVRRRGCGELWVFVRRLSGI